MPGLKLTKESVSQIVKPDSGQVDYFDTLDSGFGVRATRDALTFFVRRRLKGTTQKPFIRIGTFGVWTVAQAREEAKRLIRCLDMGENPQQKAQTRAETLTLADLYRQYISIRKTLSDASRYQYDSWMRNCFADWLEKEVTTITGSVVLERLAKLEETRGKGQAINAVKLLRGMYRFGSAVHPDIITRNPVEAVREVRQRDWTKRDRRKTFIRPEQLPAWYKAVQEYENLKGRDYLLMLLYTGLRRSEAARMKWSDLDFRNRTYSFTPEKKRSDDPENARVTMPMSEQLYRILLKRRAVGYENEYIFPGKYPSPFLSNPDHFKRHIITASGITFCFHDLRRTFITIAESLDIPHYALKALLNHSMGNDVTGGYIQINPDRLREPVQRVADRITELVSTFPVEERTTIGGIV